MVDDELMAKAPCRTEQIQSKVQHILQTRWNYAKWKACEVLQHKYFKRCSKQMDMGQKTTAAAAFVLK